MVPWPPGCGRGDRARSEGVPRIRTTTYCAKGAWRSDGDCAAQAITPGESRTDRPFDRCSDSVAARHPAGGTTRRRIGPNVGGPFDVSTVRAPPGTTHRPRVTTSHGQTSTSSGTSGSDGISVARAVQANGRRTCVRRPERAERGEHPDPVRDAQLGRGLRVAQVRAGDAQELGVGDGAGGTRRKACEVGHDAWISRAGPAWKAMGRPSGSWSIHPTPAPANRTSPGRTMRCGTFSTPRGSDPATL